MSENWHDCSKCGLAISHGFFPPPVDDPVKPPASPDGRTDAARIRLALAALACLEDDDWFRDSEMMAELTRYPAAGGANAINSYRDTILGRAREKSEGR